MRLGARSASQNFVRLKGSYRPVTLRSIRQFLMPSLSASTSSRSFVAIVCLVAATASHGQALPPGVRLGMSAAELQATVSGLERVVRPQRLGGGLAGNWQALDSIAGTPFETVYFFAGGQLRRVERTANTQTQPDLGAAAYADMVAWGRQNFGPELTSSDPGSAYAAWVQGDTDIYAQFISDPRRAGIRLVYKSRQIKDGNEL